VLLWYCENQTADSIIHLLSLIIEPGNVSSSQRYRKATAVYKPCRAGHDDPPFFYYPTPVELPRGYLYVTGEDISMAGVSRSDRAPGNRGAYEKARLKILKTQTVCGICGKPVDFSYKYPHSLSPTVDHIIPIARGGHPSALENLQLAHRCCNRQKSDEVMGNVASEPVDDQLISNDQLELHCDWTSYRAIG
jgi:5-methylcytosine-specific restriction endonuclease McrA